MDQRELGIWRGAEVDKLTTEMSASGRPEGRWEWKHGMERRQNLHPLQAVSALQKKYHWRNQRINTVSERRCFPPQRTFYEHPFRAASSDSF